MPLSEEQLAKLPYQTTPADVADVVKELTDLVALVAGVVAGGLQSFGRPVGNRTGAQVVAEMLADRTMEPGMSVTVQETRLALALESWSGDTGKFVMTTVLEATAGILADSFGGLHSVAHGTTPEPERHLFVVDTEGAVDNAGTVPPDEDGS